MSPSLAATISWRASRASHSSESAQTMDVNLPRAKSQWNIHGGSNPGSEKVGNADGLDSRWRIGLIEGQQA